MTHEINIADFAAFCRSKVSLRNALAVAAAVLVVGHVIWTATDPRFGGSASPTVAFAAAPSSHSVSRPVGLQSTTEGVAR